MKKMSSPYACLHKISNKMLDIVVSPTCLSHFLQPINCPIVRNESKAVGIVLPLFKDYSMCKQAPGLF